EVFGIPPRGEHPDSVGNLAVLKGDRGVRFQTRTAPVELRGAQPDEFDRAHIEPGGKPALGRRLTHLFELTGDRGGVQPHSANACHEMCSRSLYRRASARTPGPLPPTSSRAREVFLTTTRRGLGWRQQGCRRSAGGWPTSAGCARTWPHGASECRSGKVRGPRRRTRGTLRARRGA